MPQGDRTGPMGQGSRTGRSFGFCSGNNAPGYTTGFGERMRRGSIKGRGMGRSRGMGRGRGVDLSFAGFSGTPDRISSMKKNEEIRILKSQMDELRQTQGVIEKRLEELTH